MTGGVRLKSIQYPLSGLRVVGAKVVEAGSCLAIPSFSAPLVDFRALPTPCDQTQEVSKVSFPADQEASDAGSTLAGSFTALPVEDSQPQESLGVSKDIVEDIVAAVLCAPAAFAPVSPPFEPSWPAPDEIKEMAFQLSKKPGSFGLKSKVAAAAAPTGVSKVSKVAASKLGGSTRRH